MSCWMYVGCALDVRWMMLDVSCQYDRSQNVGKVVFCNCWACSQNPCYGMCVFLRRFCLNKCDDLAVKLACQGGTHFGSFSRIMFYLSSLFRLERSRWLQCYLVSARCPHPFCLYNFIAPNGVWSRSCENAYDCMSRGSRTRETHT